MARETIETARFIRDGPPLVLLVVLVDIHANMMATTNL